VLLDDGVGVGADFGGDAQSERFGRREINGEIVVVQLLDRNFAGFGPDREARLFLHEEEILVARQ
jgi:hypothetical protein